MPLPPAAACLTCPTLLTAVPDDLTCPRCGSRMVAAGGGAAGPAHGGLAYELALGAAGAVVGLHGEVDLGSADVVRGAVGRALAAGPRTLLVDLADVTFADSTILSVLLDAQRGLGDGEALVTVAPRPEARLVFRVAGLEEHLGMRESRERAMAELLRRAPAR